MGGEAWMGRRGWGGVGGIGLGAAHGVVGPESGGDEIGVCKEIHLKDLLEDWHYTISVVACHIWAVCMRGTL